MLKIVANISTLFHELPMLERFRAAREAGFDGVEPPRFRCRESIQVLIERRRTAASTNTIASSSSNFCPSGETEKSQKRFIVH
jgi:hydroxypyruvate isomerase